MSRLAFIQSNLTGAERAAQRTRYGFRRKGKKHLGKCVFADLRSNSGDRQFSRHLLRLREIEHVLRTRYGLVIPETDDASPIEAAAYAMNAHCLAVGGDFEVVLRNWCSVWAPWANARAGDLIRPILNGLTRRRQDLSADAVARLLGVKFSERQMLGLVTIGSCDVPMRARRQMAKQHKRAQDKARQQANRKQAGSVDRKTWVASSTTKQAPWLAEGISRRTWYRRRGTGPSRVGYISTSDGPVPNAAEQGAGAGHRASFSPGPIDAGSADLSAEPLNSNEALDRMGDAA